MRSRGIGTRPGKLAWGVGTFLCLSALNPGAPRAAADPSETYRSGPTIVERGSVPPAADAPFLPWDGSDPLPAAPEFRNAVASLLSARGGVLLAGRTDPIGPRSLNDSLGLQLAARAAALLAREMGVPRWRFAATTLGEVAEPGGVHALPWQPPSPAGQAALPAVVLEPSPGGAGGTSVWGVWEPGAAGVRIGFQGNLAAQVWELEPGNGQARLAVCQGVTGVGVAALLPDGKPAADVVSFAGPEGDRALAVQLDSVEGETAWLSASIPSGYRRPTLWAAGVPYPVAEGLEHSARLPVVLAAVPREAYLTALDRAGRPVAGPPLTLPGVAEDRPELLAILVWEGEGVDLDLHLWQGLAHTQPRAPDPLLSPEAVAGSRQLFDGDAETRASAVVMRRSGDPSPVHLEAWCYSDLGGNGARAWVYLLEHPGDPVAERLRVLGPRQLSEAPTEARWPVAVWQPESTQP